ncbi:DUF6979 family protein [uncultured Draconibacterium sp.]|uniref:DUF6979 family protein n=1 Tax=uncultured Draconibacterium sp. TaxID=1573823 RepID=UPI0029C73DF1|nr:hypothetical protein [uncultured Draconibacterium sp.]
MNKYAKAAIIAAQTLKTRNPMDAWQFAVQEIFPQSEESRKKSCPKNAFLGLCEEGIIKNSEPGNYSKSIDNKNYAISAINILKQETGITTKNELWRLVTEGNNKKHNSQMDVVLALWNNNLIR